MSDERAPVDAVVFDWGGTLSIWAEVEMEDMWRLAADHIAADTGADAAALLAELVAVEHELWVECAQRRRGAASFRLVDIFDAASDAVGVDVAGAVLEEAAMRHLDTWTPHVRHDPDAASALSELAGMGVRLGLLSNTHWPAHFHEHFLERDGLLDYLATRVYSSHEPWMKPHPEIFRTTLARLGVRPERTLFVGDRMWDDVWGAQQAGMRGVWKQTSAAEAHPGVTPDFVVSRLTHLVELVRALND